jgi:hypothetical protein
LDIVIGSHQSDRFHQEQVSRKQAQQAQKCESLFCALGASLPPF